MIQKIRGGVVLTVADILEDSKKLHYRGFLISREGKYFGNCIPDCQF